MGKLVQPQNLTPETYTKLLMDVATAANEAHTIEEAVQLCLERICVHTNWCIGHAYLVENEKCDDFDRAPIWYLDTKRFEGLQQCIESRSIPLRTDLPERVIKSEKIGMACGPECGQGVFACREKSRPRSKECFCSADLGVEESGCRAGDVLGPGSPDR